MVKTGISEDCKTGGKISGGDGGRTVNLLTFYN